MSEDTCSSDGVAIGMEVGILRVTPGFGDETKRCSYEDDVAAEYGRTIRSKEVDVTLEASGLT